MFNGPLISFSFGFIFGGTNLICATSRFEIFVDCFRNDELFTCYYFISEFFEFLPLECNLNLFDHI